MKHWLWISTALLLAACSPEKPTNGVNWDSIDYSKIDCPEDGSGSDPGCATKITEGVMAPGATGGHSH